MISPTPHAPMRIGLTGGVGSGKSTVAALFAARGVPVVEADGAARVVVAPGKPAIAAIRERFGVEALNAAGELNRPWLRERVFADAALRQALEALLHPLIREEMERATSALNAPYCLWEVPLLLESGWQAAVDRILVVDAPPELQVIRTMRRDKVGTNGARAIIAAQIPRESRIACADDVILNDGDLRGLEPQVDELHRRYTELACRHGRR